MNGKNNVIHLRFLSALGLFYIVILVYASLMPFDIASLHHVLKSIPNFDNYWPINRHARISGSDLMSNLVLYFPLGWIIALRCKLSRLGAVSSMVIAALGCSLLSISIELGQLATYSRIASAADWLLNTISGFTGALIGILRGETIWIRGIRWLQQRWRTRPANIGALALLSLLAADAWAPYMPTILLKQVRRSLQGSHWNIMEGLALHPWHWWLATRVLVYAIVTILLAHWNALPPKKTFKTWFYAAVFVVCFAFILEFFKLIIISRYFNAANVAASMAGCFAAFLIPVFSLDRRFISRKLDITIATLIIYLFYLWWNPFNFIWNFDLVRNALPSPVQLLPFYHYAMGAELNHIRLFVQSVFFLALLVYLLRIRFKWNAPKYKVVITAVLFSCLLGLLFETGQFFLPSRTPSMTDVYCFAIGGGLGAWLRLPSPSTHNKGGPPT